MAAVNSSNRISVQEAADAIDEIMALDEDDQEALQGSIFPLQGINVMLTLSQMRTTSMIKVTEPDTLNNFGG